MASVKIIGKVAVKVMPDTKAFPKVLKTKLEKIENSTDALEVDVLPKISAATKKHLQGEMAALKKKLDGTVDLDVDLNNKDIAVAETLLAVLTRGRRVEIKTHLDNESIRNAFENILMLGGARPQLDGLAEAFERLKRLDYIAINTGVMATKVTLLGGAAAATTGQLLSLSGSIGQIVPAGLALPGIFGGIAIGLGASAAALKDFNKYVPQASIYMGELQKVISGNFWAVAAKRVNAFVDGVFPILLKNLSVTGTALGNFFGGFAASLGESLNPGLGAMFDDLNKSIGIATGHTDSFATIIRVLGEIGASYLPRLAAWFGTISDQFAAFLKRTQADGSLKGWIDAGITSLIGLAGVLYQTYAIFKGLAKAAAAAGGVTTTSLAAGLKGIADVINSPAFQTGLTEFFASTYEMMGNITSGAGPGFKKFLITLVDVFNSVGPALGESMGTALGSLFDALSGTKSVDGMLAVFDGIQAAMDNLLPTIPLVVDMFASFGPVMGALMTQISAIMAEGIDRLSPTIQGLADAIVPVINRLGELFTNITADLVPVFQITGESITRMVEKFVPLIAQIQALWNIVSPFLIPVLKIVATIIGDALVGVVVGLTMVFKGLVKIVTGVIDVFKGIGNILAGLFTLDFSQVSKGIGQLFGGLWNIVKGALQAVVGGIWAWANGSLFAVFRNTIGKLGAKLLGPLLRGVTTWLSAGFQWIVRGSLDGIKSLDTIFYRILDVLLQPFEKFLPGITNLVKSVFAKMGLAIRGAFAKISGLFSGGGSGPSQWTRIFRETWDVIKLVFTTAVAILKTTLVPWVKFIATLIKVYVKSWISVFSHAWTVISTVFHFALSIIKRVIIPWVKFIATLIKVYVGAWVTIFKNVWGAVSLVFTSVLNIIKLVFIPWVKFIATLIKVYVKAWIAVFKVAWAVIKGVFAAGLAIIRNVVIPWVKFIASLIKAYVGAWITIFKNAWGVISLVFTTVLRIIKAIILPWVMLIAAYIKSYAMKWVAIFKAAWSIVKTVFTVVLSFIKGVWTRVSAATKAIWNGVKNFLTTVFGAIKSKVVAVWNSVKTKISNTWNSIKTKVLTEAKNIRLNLALVWGAIATKIKSVWTTIKTNVGNAVTAVKKKISDAWDAIKTKVVSAWESVVTKVETGIGNVVKKVEKLPNKALTAVAGIGSVLLNAGKDLVKGFIDGIQAKFEAVKKKLKALTDLLPDWKGPVARDRTLLTPAGELIIDSLIAGLESRYKDVRDSLQGLTTDIAKDFDGSAIEVGVAANLSTAGKNLSAVGGLVGKVNASTSNAVTNDGDVRIDNITIPLEDLKQLRSLEEFLDMLRVRTRQGALA